MALSSLSWISRTDREARDSQSWTLLLVTCSRKKGCYGDNESLEYLETLATTAALLLLKGARVKAPDRKRRNLLRHVLASILGRAGVQDRARTLCSEISNLRGVENAEGFWDQHITVCWHSTRRLVTLRLG